MNKILLSSESKIFYKTLVNELASDEIDFFDSIWEVLRESYNKWDNINPIDWKINKPFNKFNENLAFADGRSNLVTPIIIATVAATLMHFRDYDLANITSERIQIIVKKYAGDFGAPNALINHLARIIPQIFDSKYLVTGLKTKTEERYNALTYDAPDSKVIDSQEMEKMRSDPEILFISGNKLFFQHRILKINPKTLEFIKILVKHPNQVFSYPDLELKISGSKRKNRLDSRRYIQQIKNRLCSGIPEFGEYIGVHDGYYLIEEVKYCIIQGVELPAEENDNQAR